MRFTSGITLGRDETRWKLSVTAEAYASPACSQLASILTHPATLQIFSLNRCRLVMWSSHCELDLISYQKCKKRRKKPTLLTVSVYPPPYSQVFVIFFGVFISDPSPIIALCIKNNGRYDIEAEKREELENKSSHKSDIWPPAASKTLPKAQRTRGLSSSCQSNFLRSYHKFKHKSWANFHLQNPN